MAHNALQALARVYGIYTTYEDVWKSLRRPSQESILRTLQLLGAPLARPGDAAGAVRSRRQELWREWLEPVVVAWDGQLPGVNVRLPDALQNERYRGRIELEDGGTVEFEGRAADLPVGSRSEVEGVGYTRRRMAVPSALPYGYHRLHLAVGSRQAESLVIAAPTRAYSDAGSGVSGGPSPHRPAARSTEERRDPLAAAGQQRLWGVFLPLYALHRQSSAGAGDFSDLEALMEWTAARGGNLVATLPLLATLWELTEDPSPYNPATRLFWNEFYLDPRRIPGIEACPAAREQLQALSSAATQPRGAGADLVDYAGQLAVKRRALEALAAEFFARPSSACEALVQYCRQNPELEPFARFRAVGERQGRPWPQWPEPLRSGTVTAADYDEDVFRYHLFTQWQVEQQLEALTGHARQLNLLWYLDVPLGVNGDGYDVWREPELFVREASGGAPPDSFFTKGQNWGFPPFQPHALRRQEYGYFIRALRNHLRHARVLRLDHVMGLYRLYWIPHGFPSSDGTYVRYRMDELCAILTLESHRFGARIVGENLGTVPPAVDEAMLRHGLDDMYVLQYETNPEKGPALRPPGRTSVASVNTHDMPQFAAYWQGLDIDDRLELGLFTPDEAEAERARRAELRTQLVAFLQAERLLDSGAAVQGGLYPSHVADKPVCDNSREPSPSDAPELLEVLEACQAYLAKSPARIVQVNLEDLWAETEPQNRPGTYREHPNWQRRARYPLETFRDMPAVERILATVDRLRQEAEAEEGGSEA